MARGTINIATLLKNAGSTPVTTAIDGVNGLTVAAAGGVTKNLVFRIANTGGTIGTVLINPGSYPPAFQAFGGTVAPGGSISVVLAATTGVAFLAVESARVTQGDGSIYIDFLPTSMAGTVECYRMPYDI